MIDLGLSCPADGLVAGIDDFRRAGPFAPRLSPQRQPIDALADHAVRILRARFHDRMRDPERTVLASGLIARDTCALPGGLLLPSGSRRLRTVGHRKADPSADP